jgi:hypothetical protein
MSSPALNLEYWVYQHEGLLRALQLTIDDITESQDDGHPANYSALTGLHKALTNHLGEIQSIQNAVGIVMHRERKRALGKMQAEGGTGDEPPSVQ